MEISIPTAVDLIDSNVVDHTEAYDQTKHIEYKKGMRLQDRSEIWERTGADIYPPAYDPAKNSTYKTGDILWASAPVDDGYGGSGTVKGVLQVAGRSTQPIPKQPDLYPKVEGNFDNYTQWKERYVLAKTGVTGTFNGFTRDAGTGPSRYVHRLFRDEHSVSGWTYSVTKQNVDTPFWNDSEFAVPDKVHPNAEPTYVRLKLVTNSADKELQIMYKGTKVSEYPNNHTDPLLPYQTIINANVQGNAYTGINFMVGDLERVQKDAHGVTYKFYRVSIQGHRSEQVTSKAAAFVYDYVDGSTVEVRSYYAGVGPKDKEYAHQKDTNYILRTFIVRGANVYARTNRDATQLMSTTTKPKLEKLASIAEFLGGWTFVSPINKLKPFDGKNHTKIEATGEITFKLNVNGGKFNTIAFTGLMCDDLDIETREGSVGTGPQNLNLQKYNPDGSRDIHKRLPEVPTTAIIYNDLPNGGTTDTPAGGEILITIKGKNIELGGILVGLSVNAGFTNLSFANKYKDWSPYEKDQWGNVTYIEGVKTNIHSGTVDVPIRHYDMMNRLMVSLGRGLVILNGSDNLSNVPPDNNQNIFASTMVVGRMRDFMLKTNLDNKHMGEMATYSFTIEEEI